MSAAGENSDLRIRQHPASHLISVVLRTKLRLTMTGLLKPFNWVNPVIFSVPSRHYLLLNSPVPIVAGVLADRHTFERDIKPELESEYETGSYLIVYLDEYRRQIEHAHKQKLEADEPVMKKLLRSDSAKKLLQKLGSAAKSPTKADKYSGSEKYEKKEILETSRYLPREFLPPVFDEALLNELREEYVNYLIDSQSGALQIQAHFRDKALQLGLNISLILRKMFQDRILAFLPEIPPMKPHQTATSAGFQASAQQRVDHEQIVAAVVRNNTWDELFLLNFLQTQSFTFYLDKHYKSVGG